MLRRRASVPACSIQSGDGPSSVPAPNYAVGDHGVSASIAKDAGLLQKMARRRASGENANR